MRTFPARYLLSPPRLQLDAGGETASTGVTAIVQNGAPFTYFQDRPIDLAAMSPTGLGRACGERAAPRDAARRCPRSAGAHSPRARA